MSDRNDDAAVPRPIHPGTNRQRANVAVSLLLAGAMLLLAGCGPAPVPPEALNQSYERALARTSALAANFPPGGPDEQAAFARVKDYFANLTMQTVQDKTLNVYAPDAYLNDTLVGIEGAEKIRDYFLHTASRTRSVKVDFREFARTGVDYFVRWQMIIDAEGLGGGKPVASYGVSQLRFANDGRILIHKDFWDSATGLWEHAPLIGSVMRRARAAAQGSE